MNNKILFFLIAALLAGSLSMYADHHHHHQHAIHHQKVSDAHIAGHVLDAQTGEHLPYVNVQVEGTTLGCLTDESGHFYLKNLPEGELTLIFSMMGYESEKRTVTLH
jgi:outer membrane receptor for ferrienterochelin and colicins